MKLKTQHSGGLLALFPFPISRTEQFWTALLMDSVTFTSAVKTVLPPHPSQHWNCFILGTTEPEESQLLLLSRIKGSPPSCVFPFSHPGHEGCSASGFPGGGTSAPPARESRTHRPFSDFSLLFGLGNSPGVPHLLRGDGEGAERNQLRMGQSKPESRAL